MRIDFWALVFCFFLTACQSEAPLYETPEASLRAYQRFIDNNEFEAAKSLSTPREQRRLETMSKIIFEDDLDSTVLNTRFLQLQCVEQGDTATCRCEIEDQYERYSEQFRLIKIAGQWKVDAPDEEIIIELEHE